MSSGAYALYIDLAAGSGGGGGGGGGNNAPIHRVVPLPHIVSQADIHFDHRRLILSYDNLGGGPDPLPVGVRFIDDHFKAWAQTVSATPLDLGRGLVSWPRASGTPLAGP